MKGWCETFRIIDAVHDVEITVLVKIPCFNQARLPLAIAFGTTMKFPEPFLYGFVVIELITLSLWVLGGESESVAILLVALLVLPITSNGLRTQKVGLRDILFQHVL